MGKPGHGIGGRMTKTQAQRTQPSPRKCLEYILALFSSHLGTRGGKALRDCWGDSYSQGSRDLSL